MIPSTRPKGPLSGVTRLEIYFFLLVSVFIWLNEILDLPHLLFGAEPTPLNWREALFESVMIASVGAVCVALTRRLLRRIRKLEGLLPVCARCKKIRDESGEWQPMETFISQRSEADFTHGICPECASELYPGRTSRPDTPGPGAS